mgnify:CR=1 FL=1
MTMNRTVVWNEGLLLTPQHLQQWARHLEGLIAERFRIHDPFAWGLTDLDLDHDGLANGRFTLLKCRLVLPDAVVEVPDGDAESFTCQETNWAPVKPSTKKES